MTIRFRCKCGQNYTAKEERAGRSFACHQCQERILVPAPSLPNGATSRQRRPAPAAARPPPLPIPALEINHEQVWQRQLGLPEMVLVREPPAPPSSGPLTPSRPFSATIGMNVGGLIAVSVLAVGGVCVLLLAAQVHTSMPDQSAAAAVPTDRVPQPVNQIAALDQPETIVAERTKQAWNQVRQVNLELKSLVTSNLTEALRQSYLLYGQIPLEKVDRDLAAAIEDWIRVSAELHEVIATIENENALVMQSAQSVQNAGARIGSTYSNNPQGGAVAGEMFFGLLAAAAADTEVQRIAAKHEPRVKELCAEADEIRARLVNLQPVLCQRYHAELPNLLW